MLQNRKVPKGGLLLAGLAAFAYYKYSKMSEDQKRNLVSGLKEKGKKLYDEYMPTEIKNMLGKKKIRVVIGIMETRTIILQVRT